MDSWHSFVTGAIVTAQEKSKKMSIELLDTEEPQEDTTNYDMKVGVEFSKRNGRVHMLMKSSSFYCYCVCVCVCMSVLCYLQKWQNYVQKYSCQDEISPDLRDIMSQRKIFLKR